MKANRRMCARRTCPALSFVCARAPPGRGRRVFTRSAQVSTPRAFRVCLTAHQIPARAIGPADLARGRLAEAPLAGELIDQQHALAILRQPGRGVVRLLAALAPASM